MNDISITTLMKTLRKREEKGEWVTLLGIGPMSLPVIEATLELAREDDFPVMFIASRNQVDAEEFGRGYVCNWDQQAFADAVFTAAAKTGFDGLCYLCRDHGGPWQRDEERGKKLPADEAMELARRSYRADLLAGFHLLHIDPTKDPHAGETVSLDAVLSRTVELIRYAEQERLALELPPVAYEVGTEETNGGLTSADAYENFTGELVRLLTEENLPSPLFVVGQTGTLTRLTENVGRFDASAARRLSAAARAHGAGLKEHNADYLSDATLTLHPALGVTAANVAPEFGVEETAAYLMLAEVEERLCREGQSGMTPSDFANVLRRAAVRTERWRKWLVGDDTKRPLAEAMDDSALSGLIARVGGHYTFENPEVKQAMAILFKNLERAGLNPRRAVIDRVKRSIRRYSDCLGLKGLTAKIRAAL